MSVAPIAALLALADRPDDRLRRPASDAERAQGESLLAGMLGRPPTSEEAGRLRVGAGGKWSLLTDHAIQLEERAREQRAAESAAIAEQERQRRERIQLEEKFKRREWDSLPQDARMMFLLALALEDGGDVIEAVRQLANRLSTGRPLEWPGRAWWPQRRAW